MKRTLIYITLFVLVLVGCSHSSDSSHTDKQQDDHKAKPEKQKNKDQDEPDGKLAKIKTIDLKTTREALKQQSSGTLVKNVAYKKETKPITWALPDLKESKKKALTKQLKQIASKTQNPKDLQKSLVYLLGSPHYRKAIQHAEGFQADFDQPYLPEPKDMEKKNENQQPGKAIILLDASSSMLLDVDGKQKMKVAKRAVKRFAKTMGQNKDNEVSLVVYGHKGSESKADKKLSCHSIDKVYPMSQYDDKKFNQSLDKFQSKGWTPLAGAVKKANKMSKFYEGKVTVYIVSDGKETCGGNPVKAAKSFTKSDGERTVNIIGFDVDNSSENQLSKVADAGNGKYYAADDPEKLDKTFKKKILPSTIELAWAHTKGPNGWDITSQNQRFDKRLKKLRAIVRREDHRYKIAVQIMQKVDWVDQDTIDKLSNMRQERYAKMMDMVKEFKHDKHDEIEQDADDIKEKIDNWVERMKNVKEQQRD